MPKEHILETPRDEALAQYYIENGLSFTVLVYPPRYPSSPIRSYGRPIYIGRHRQAVVGKGTALYAIRVTLKEPKKC